jgi:hypothetical protein
MSREILVNYRGTLSSFTLDRIERSRLYGERKRMILGPDSQPCQAAELVEEGDVILSPGMTATIHLDQDRQPHSMSALVGIGSDGKLAPKVQSTLGVAQALEGPISPLEALDMVVDSVYALSPDQLDLDLLETLNKGAIFRFSFNYRADYHASTALLVANEHGIFALVGEKVQPSWCGPDSPPHSQIQELVEEELDFEMF